jgi:hypothetical protein
MKENFTKTSQVFRHCYKLIDNGSFDFICHAIYDAAFGDEWAGAWINQKMLTGKPHAAQEHIRALLGGSSTLSGWMVENTANFQSMERTLSYGQLRAKMRETRLAWLKSLIEEFEAKGD